MPVFKADMHMPPLPLPGLSETCERVKELIRPLSPPEDYARACLAVDEFAVSGKPLQEMLCAFRDRRGGNESWLRPLWDDSYLAWRGRLPMEMNYGLELCDERWGDKALASFMLAMCRFLRRTGSGNLRVEEARGAPLTMDSLRFMAYTRIPCHARDILYRVPLSGPARAAVVSRGRWFLLTLSDAGGAMVSVDEADEALRSIAERAARQPPQPEAGAMTSAKREDAAVVRGRLLEEAANRCALADIENCLFSVSLDEGGENFGHDLIAGEAANRWHDKSLQIIAGPDGRFGISLEHTGTDAGLWLYALDWVDRYIKENPEGRGGGVTPAIRPVFWKTDQETAAELSRMSAAHREHKERMGCVFRLFGMVDRKKVKALGHGPDVFIQLAFQSAYYRLVREHPSVYESVSVRNFYQGRTECARPATASALEFARLMAEDPVDADALSKVFVRAGKEHRDRLEYCKKGLGVERHLFGLSMMAKMRPPEGGAASTDFFSDPALLASTRDTLSTSSVAGPSVRFFGFGPAVDDGLGIGYAMTGGGLQFTVTSLPGSKTTAVRYAAEMETVLKLMIQHLPRGAGKGLFTL